MQVKGCDTDLRKFVVSSKTVGEKRKARKRASVTVSVMSTLMGMP